MNTFSDDDYLDQKADGENSNQRLISIQNSLLDAPLGLAAAVEHKKGYMMRKCCYESNYKKSESIFMFIFIVYNFIIFSINFNLFGFSICSSVRKKIMENVLLYAERFSIVYA